MKKLFINLVFQTKLPKKIPKKSDLIDLTNSLVKLRTVNEFYISKEINREALLQYENLVDHILSHNFILKLTVSRFPIYWLTNFSIKWNHKHWAFGIIKLIYIIKKSKNKISKHYNFIVLFLPNVLSKSENNIIEFFKETLPDFTISIKYCKPELDKYYNDGISPRNSTFLNFMRKLKLIAKFIISTNTKISNEEEKTKNIFFTEFPYAIEKNRSNYTNVYSTLKNLCLDNGTYISTISTCHWFSNKIGETKLPSSFIKSRPGIIDTLKILKSLYGIKIKIKKYRTDSFKIFNFDLDTNFIIDEISYVCDNAFSLSRLINYKWLKFFFDSELSIKNIFYEDELLEHGKIISFAKNNSINSSQIRSHGLQHGNITFKYLTYHVTKLEHENKIPLPDFILLWGAYFKDQFKNSLLNKNVVLKDLGSLNHLILREQNNSIINSVKDHKNKLSFLWCITDKQFLNNEIKILLESQFIRDNKLIVRPHPALKINEISPFLIDLNYSWSTTFFAHEDIINSDVVMVNPLSTISLDAINLKTNLICLDSNINTFIENPKLKYCYKGTELDQYLNKLLINDKIDASLATNSFFFLGENLSKWRDYVKSNL